MILIVDDNQENIFSLRSLLVLNKFDVDTATSGEEALKKILQNKDFEILDSIRGIASLYVTIAHCRGTLWVGGKEFMKMFPVETWNVGDYLMFGSSMFTRLAVEFVIVFFVLSGFSIAHSLASNKSPGQFYLRRFIRIYPSYVVALVWAGIVFALTRSWHPHWYDGTFTNFSFERTPEMNNFFDRTVILNNLLYMPSAGFIFPFWSLTYEVMFYLLAPFILRQVNVYVIISIALFLVNLLFPSFTASWNLHPYFFGFLFLYNIYFSIGVALYSNFEWVKEKLAGVSKRNLLFVVLLLLGLTYSINLYTQTEGVYSFLPAAMLSAFLIIFFIRYQVRIPFLMKIGSFSYTLYITHYASVFLYLGIYHLIFRPDKQYILNYFVWIPAVFFALGIAYLQYLLVERRTKDILNMLRSKKTVKLMKTA